MDNNENKSRTESQCKRIIKWLLQHPGKGLTHLSAINMFGCIELPKRISELVERGFPIQRDRTITNEYGVRFKEYYIKEEDAARYVIN